MAVFLSGDCDFGGDLLILRYESTSLIHMAMAASFSLALDAAVSRRGCLHPFFGR